MLKISILKLKCNSVIQLTFKKKLTLNFKNMRQANLYRVKVKRNSFQNPKTLPIKHEYYYIFQPHLKAAICNYNTVVYV